MPSDIRIRLQIGPNRLAGFAPPGGSTSVEARDLQLLAYNGGAEPAPNFIVELMFSDEYTLDPVPGLVARGKKTVRYGAHEANLTWYQTSWSPRAPLFREARGQSLLDSPLALKTKTGPRLILWRTLAPGAEPREELWQMRADDNGQLKLHLVERGTWHLYTSLDDPDPPD